MSLLAWATEVLIGAALFCIAAFVILFRANFTWLRAMGELVKLLIRIKRHTKRVLRTSSGDGRYGAAKDGFRAWTVVDMFQEAFAARPNQAMIIMADTGEVATYADIDVRSNRFARWLLQPRDQQGLGFPPGTTVALLMPNCIDYVAVWLGVAKAKGTTALVNTNLTGASLVHAIKTALAGTNRKLLVTSPEVAATSLSGETLAQLKADIGGELEVFVLSAPEALATGDGRPASSSGLLDNGPLGAYTGDSVESLIANENAAAGAAVGALSTLFFIYTSGTTGFPKASKINHLRFWSAGATLWTLCRLTPSDRLYTALPLYHASGGMMGISAVFLSGATLVLRPKFSASQFSRDLTEHRCTALQYIGEMCRYLVAAKANPLDGSQRIKCASGNGLRPEVWERFTRRYNVARIVEFYAATEGNTNLFNNAGVVGAVGVVPWFARFIYPVKLAKFDEEKGELIRDPATGLCSECLAGEVGQVVGLIKDRDPLRRFDGYTDPAATSKKIGANLFSPGDKYFLSGDLLKQDAWGFYFWHDRIGDTFRWKGENVSTAEVSCVLSQVLGEQLADVNVYGVLVPHSDGRAGMAALSLSEGVSLEDVDWSALFSRLGSELAAYAQPVFLRVARQGLTYTSTFKHKKTDLRNEGFSLERISDGAASPDIVLIRDAKAKAYVPLTSDLEAKISNGSLRL